MESNICMNGVCRTTTSSPEWKKGWGLKSGGLATLCYNCGLAYENALFCETFHREESGWRECKFCKKHIHCGCIASKFLHDYLDFGGVACLSCIKCSESQLIRQPQIPSDDIYSGLGTLAAICDPQSSIIENRMERNNVDKGKLLSKTMEENHANRPNLFFQSQKVDQNSSSVQTKREESMLPAGEVGTGFSHLSQQSSQYSVLSKQDGNRPAQGLKDIYESLCQTSLSFSFGTALSTPGSIVPLPEEIVTVREKKKVPPFQQGQRSRHILPKPSKSAISMCSPGSKGVVTQTRVARPPVEGRGRNQLLPRYWPRITDEELQKICGDLNSTIVPLFEKVLSASDAGRIGRLVLPKACAEAYFPPINQSEGVPIRMKDIMGKEWSFQFRFWPNNNSRMYVLEGVTPCIQNMRLQAGDTVTFSRIDPEGKLVMGCRKASNSVDLQTQDTPTCTLPNGGSTGDGTASDVNEDLSKDTFGWSKNKEHVSMTNGDSRHQQTMLPEKKKSRPIGSKSKRLLMHSEDALELRITWEEAQELLRPPPSVKPTIVIVENHEFEEYDEPPVFGKRTIFAPQESGEQEQWAQCDCCSKWRRVPLDILLPAKWACPDNIWDSNRSSCAAPCEMDPKKLESCLRGAKDFKKRKSMENRVTQECEPSGLDALATAAVLGDHVGDSCEPSAGVATTRHPRHRPGCTCIVCIQPPSGKGKHKPTCICNVCVTVKRRFKTLMLRKKKRQEHEAEIDRERDRVTSKGTSDHVVEHVNGSEIETGKTEVQLEMGGSPSTSKGDLDLNCDPSREDDMLLTEAARMDMTTMVHAANVSFEMYTGENGVPTFKPCLLSKASVGESSIPGPDELTSIDVEQRTEGDDE